ncbi:MAG TPA: hypothetical protein QF716_01765 [Candidatus Thalassarchaeaceae archaeon]|jgi:hypothetical protein|nr:hypothetical protein [Candidatus Thalassarchaeaceae archaeon]HJM67588.1 hypothetical protein [Candidatus Thalassarchaeaceae archaeon]
MPNIFGCNRFNLLLLARVRRDRRVESDPKIEGIGSNDSDRMGLSILTCCVGLATILAISPSILLPADAGVDVITRDNLSDAQVVALAEADFAITPAQLNEARMAIHLVLLDENSTLMVAGTWNGTLELGDMPAIESSGSRDVFFASLGSDGRWQWQIVLAGDGYDSISTLEETPDHWIIRGRFHGSLSLGDDAIESDNNWSASGYEAWIGPDERLRLWQYDTILLPSASADLWCGFR